MPSQCPHAVTSPVVRNVRCVANRQNHQKRGPSGNSELPPAKGRIPVLAGKKDSSQGGHSVACTIQGQNSTPSSSRNNSRIGDITQHVTSTPSATQGWSIITPTAMPGTSSHKTPAPSGTTQTDSTLRLGSSPASGPTSCIASTPTPLSGLENLSTTITNPEAHGIITNPLRPRAPERNQRHTQCNGTAAHDVSKAG